ncbi:uncharacterized protein LOC128234289 [Mya arenaria]|uniref:uncharacterized protein LOC128234289 n=1 Tax=Mya arenaria TaxID=6604 RepID=UPI0022E28EE2|nr:uncharacterized protein LOC128234289 [Mya arenaria]
MEVGCSAGESSEGPDEKSLEALGEQHQIEKPANGGDRSKPLQANVPLPFVAETMKPDDDSIRLNCLDGSSYPDAEEQSISNIMDNPVSFESENSTKDIAEVQDVSSLSTYDTKCEEFEHRPETLGESTNVTSSVVNKVICIPKNEPSSPVPLPVGDTLKAIAADVPQKQTTIQLQACEYEEIENTPTCTSVTKLGEEMKSISNVDTKIAVENDNLAKKQEELVVSASSQSGANYLNFEHTTTQDSMPVDEVCLCHKKQFRKFKCGACSQRFKTICLLHEHLRSHQSNGSYHYDQVTYTAFPLHDASCSAMQTDIISTVSENTEVISDKEVKALIRVPGKKRGRKRKIEAIKIDLKNLKDKKGKEDILEKDSVKELKEDKSSVPQVQKKRGRKPKNKPDISTLASQSKTQIIGDAVERKDDKESVLSIKPLSKSDSAGNIEYDSDVTVVNATQTLDSAIKTEEVVDDTINEEDLEDTGFVEEELAVKVKKAKKENSLSALTDQKTRRGRKKGAKNERDKKEKSEDIFMSCEICNTVMLQRKYREHMIMHTGEKSFICEVCGAAYAKLSNLSRHKITHREVKPFKCEFCPAQFVRKKDYDGHINSHKGYRPHKCNVCDKCFLTNKGLIQHQENIHMGVTKFQCQHCERRFFKKSGLFAHQATHFEATMKCQFCDRKFRDKCGLRKHERTHTGNKHYQCHVCEHAFNQCTPFYVHMEKRHNMNREAIKTVMRVVTEAFKRDGKRVELYRIPDDVEEIMAGLELEEERIAAQGDTTPAASKPPLPRVSPSIIAHVVHKPKEKCKVPRVCNISYSGNKSTGSSIDALESGVLQVHVDSSMSNALDMLAMEQKSTCASDLITLNEKAIMAENPVSTSEMILMDYKHNAASNSSGVHFLNLDHQNRPLISTDGHIQLVSADIQIPVYHPMQPSGSHSHVSDEGLKQKSYIQAGHPKQKMKLLSQHQTFQTPWSVPTSQTDLGQGSKMQQVPIIYAPQGQSVDPLAEAYTADFIERIFQGQ